MVAFAAMLSIALVGQLPADDLACERAVEESVARWTHAAPPEPYRSLIARMGSPKWRERDAATKAAEAAGPDGRRWLWWGRMGRDPEIAVRCNAVIRRMVPCPTCKGSGSSKNWDLWPCGSCGGSGTDWPCGPWD